MRIAREAVGPEGQVVPQQWLARTSARDVDPADRRRLDLVVYGATPLGEALCCDVTLVSPLTREGRPQPSAATRDGAAITVAERRKRIACPELLRPGPQRLCVLACEVGGRWSAESLRLVTQLVRLRAQRAPAALRPAARQAWLRRWWGFLSVALQSTLAATLLGAPYVAGALCLAHSTRHSRTCCTTQPRLRPAFWACSSQGDLDLADIKKVREKKRKRVGWQLLVMYTFKIV